MKPLAEMIQPREMTRGRIVVALAVALMADVLQLLAGPLGWLFADQVIDALAMLLTMATLGFHVLLLPTFLVELVPAVDMFPTWTGCVLAVIALRRRSAPPPRREPKPIFADSERTITGSE